MTIDTSKFSIPFIVRAVAVAVVLFAGWGKTLTWLGVGAAKAAPGAVAMPDNSGAICLFLGLWFGASLLEALLPPAKTT